MPWPQHSDGGWNLFVEVWRPCLSQNETKLLNGKYICAKISFSPKFFLGSSVHSAKVMVDNNC